MGHEVMSAPVAASSWSNKNDHNEWNDVPNFDIGDGVRSAQFGVGEIIDTDGLAVTVQFAGGQTKKLNVEYARLEKL